LVTPTWVKLSWTGGSCDWTSSVDTGVLGTVLMASKG
jgi:hypothetical protein